MKMFVIRLKSGDYLTQIEITSNYLGYKCTSDRAAAHELNDFDSQLVLRRLANVGERNAKREEIPAES
jgi:hypothetical protein